MSVAWVAVGATVLGTAVSANSASKGAKAQERAVADSNATAERQQDKAIAAQERAEAQARADREPWRAAGVNALGQLTNRLAPGGDLMRNFGMNDFQADPGYAFRQAEGMKGLTNSAAARGGLLSGAALKAASSFNQGMASQEYGNAYSRFNQNRDGQYNKLASLAGVGQVAANGNAAGASQTGQNVANGMMQTGQYMGNNLIGAGNARASSYVAQGNALVNGLNQGVSAWSQYQANKPPNVGESGGVNGGGWF